MSCESEAATRNPAIVTINARPMTDTSMIGDGPALTSFPLEPEAKMGKVLEYIVNIDIIAAVAKT